MDLKEIKAVIDLMTRNGLSEFELEKGDFKLRVKRAGTGGEWIAATGGNSATTVPNGGSTAAPIFAPLASAGATASPAAGSQILSPMVGTFYRSPAPESPAFIEVGQEVNEETVVCIIEAMKVMNEIKAEIKGVVVEVLAQNGKPVEFGKPLFVVRPA